MEYHQRLQIFTENKKLIDKHNEGNHSFTSTNSGLCFFFFFFLKNSTKVICHFFSQWHWISFQTWHLPSSAKLSSGLSRRYASCAGSCWQKEIFLTWSQLFTSQNVFLHWRCCSFFFILQNCSATSGNHLSSKGPYPDSIDWRKKGNYITPVKNQVILNTNIYILMISKVLSCDVSWRQGLEINLSKLGDKDLLWTWIFTFFIQSLLI